MLKVVLITLVVVFHAAITYGAGGDWTYIDPNANDEMTGVLLTIFVIFCQSFFMGLYFFISGYFTPGSYDKKGGLHFWKDRLIHLAIPMILYTWFLSRLPNYLDEISNQGLKIPFWQYALKTFWVDADGGPTWFLLTLLGFSAIYTIFRLITHRSNTKLQSWLSNLPAPNKRSLIVAAIVIAGLMFLVVQFMSLLDAWKALGVFNLLLAFFPSYIILFIAGILAYRNDWLNKISSGMLRFWEIFSAGLIVGLPIFIAATDGINLGFDPYISGFTWRCASFCLWMGLACISFSTTLLLWMRKHVSADNHLARLAGPNTFGVYIFHPLVLVPICVALSGYPLHPLVKFILASVSAVILSFLLAAGLRRLPLLKKIL